VKIVSFNVNSLRARQKILTDFLAEVRPDVVCLQELKLTDDEFPAMELAAAGYPHQLVWGQKTYNGVAMLSREPIEDARRGFSVGPNDDQARLVQGTVGGVRILGCYAPNGTELGSDRFAYKLTFYARLLRELSAGGRGPQTPTVLCGDLNVARTDDDTWSPGETAGKLHCHPVERDAFERLIGWGLIDTFRQVHPDQKDFTWWDYRLDAFKKDQGLRIDYLLATAPVASRVKSVAHHRALRSAEKPSDHVPVCLELDG
jgi:exodeoxyribonuclease-3